MELFGLILLVVVCRRCQVSFDDPVGLGRSRSEAAGLPVQYNTALLRVLVFPFVLPKLRYFHFLLSHGACSLCLALLPLQRFSRLVLGDSLGVFRVVVYRPPRPYDYNLRTALFPLLILLLSLK